MGLSTSTSKTKQRPYVDPVMKANLDSYAGQANNFLKSDPTQYVAPASELQTKAFGDAENLGGWKASNAQAMDMATAAGGRGPASATASLAGFDSLDPSDIQRYIDPQTDYYVNTALDAFDADVGRRGAAMQADAAKRGAFGGSRYGVAQGEFQADAARGRAGTQADLMRQAYINAAQTAMSEAARRQGLDIFNAGSQTDVSKANAGFLENSYLRELQAAGLIGDLSNSYAGNERGDVSLLGQLGAQQRGIESEFRNAVPTQLQIAGNLYGAIPPESYIGLDSVTKSKPALGSVLGSLASSAASAISFSDRRLKSNIERIGSHGKLGLYSYDMFGKRHTGVMADEVAVHRPDTLGPEVMGFATVDYGRLGLAHLVEA